MTNFLGEGPLYSTGWMDSGPLAYFSVAPKPVVLAALVVPLAVGLWTRSRGLALFGGAVLLGALFWMGLFLRLEAWGGLALAGYVVGALMLGRRSGWMPFALGGLVLVPALALGFPRSYVFDPSRCVMNLKNIATGMEMWATDHEGERPASLTQLTPNYLRTLPDCLGVAYVYEAPVTWCNNPLHQMVGHSPPRYPRVDEDGVPREFP